MSKLVAEGVGTFMLIYTVGANVLSLSGSWAGVSIGGCLMLSIYALGNVSGANFNPAVSFSLGVAKSLGGPGMAWMQVAWYVLWQLVAAVAAAFFYKFVLGSSITLQPFAPFGLWQAMICEFIYTCALVFVVLNVAMAKANTKNQFYGMAIGFVVISGATGAGAISMGAFNPAVAFALDLTSFRDGFGKCFIYVGAELAGALFAVLLFALVRPEEFPGFSVHPILSKLVSEFLGTFMLVLTVGLNVLAGAHSAAFAIACSLTSMIYALGNVSGAHFNPAVSFAILLSRSAGFGVRDFVFYVLAQLAGGISAGLLYVALYTNNAEKRSFNLGPSGEFSLTAAWVSEGVYTFLLCFVVLCVAVSPLTKSPDLYGLVIGFCITVGGNATGAISGGSFNPAVSFGIAVGRMLDGGGLRTACAYSGSQLTGAAVAAGIFFLTHQSERSNLDEKFSKLCDAEDEISDDAEG